MQNLISLNLSAQDLADLDAAIAKVRRVFIPFLGLEPADRVEMKKMGPKSRDFCEQTLNLLASNPQMVPPNLRLQETQQCMRHARQAKHSASNAMQKRSTPPYV